ncbi:hypothetical protein ACJD0Z_07550 [Flavobacteriaceae bacterium M23B6Z8]
MHGKTEKIAGLKIRTHILLLLLSCFIVISTIIAILFNDIYIDGAWINAQWMGQDVVTLFIAVPILLISRYKALTKNCYRWDLVLTGTLFYLVYTYSFYTLVAGLTFLYLFHLVIFSLALFLLLVSVYRLTQKERVWNLSGWMTYNAVVVFFAFMSIVLSILWISDIISHLTISDFKSGTPDGKPPMIIYTLDLAIIIPLMIIAVMGNLKKHAYGIILSGVMLTMATIMGFSLSGMALSLYLHQLNTDTYLCILWLILALMGGIITILFMKNIKVKQKT